MWSQQWCVTDLRNIDRESRKIICENGGKHPLGSTALLYLPRHVGGRGVKSVEAEYKQIKIKSAVKLYGNEYPTMGLVRAFEKQAAVKGHRSLVKGAGKSAEELGVSQNLSYPNPKLYEEEGKEVPKEKIKDKLKQRIRGQYAEKPRERWQGKLLTSRWDDEDLSKQEYFTWMSTWQRATTHDRNIPLLVASAHITSSYPRLYKIGTTPANGITCRLCGKGTAGMAP